MYNLYQKNKSGLTVARRIESYFGMISENTMQVSMTLYTVFVAVLYALDGIWEDRTVLIYGLTGLLGLVFSLISVLSGRLYRETDVRLLLLFLLYAWISASFCFGLSISFFCTRFFCVWMVFCSIYFVIRSVPDAERLLRTFILVFSISIGLLCLYVLLHACVSIAYVNPAMNTVRGCFQLGRLCGIGNANYMGFACTALVISSVFGWLDSYECMRSAIPDGDCRRKFSSESGKVSRYLRGLSSGTADFAGCNGRYRILRVLYTGTAALGWFALGLTGCRTGMIGVSLAVGDVVYILLNTDAEQGRASAKNRCRVPRSETKVRRIKARRFVLLTVPVVSACMMLLSFELPVILFRTAARVYCALADDQVVWGHLSSLTVRRLTDHDGTMLDRIYTWKRCLLLCFKNVRTMLLGITVFSSDGIGGVYEGHHEILVPHAHNVYLEMFRRFGLIGFLIWLFPLCLWIEKGWRTIRLRGESSAVRFLAAACAGLLVMGLAEPVPFMYSSRCQLPLLFFLICSCCVRRRNGDGLDQSRPESAGIYPGKWWRADI